MILPPLVIVLFATGLAVAADPSAPVPSSFVPPRQGKDFQRFGMVLMGDTNFSDAATQATFQSFLKLNNGRALGSYFSVGRDPLPNHVAAIAGTTVRSPSPSPSWRRSYPVCSLNRPASSTAWKTAKVAPAARDSAALMG